MLTDAHLHLVDLAERESSLAEASARLGGERWLGCVSSHDSAEFAASEALRAELRHAGLGTVACFGIHPQAPSLRHADFLGSLAASGALAAIGEAGFDFFGDRPERVRSAANEAEQREAFEFQLELALAHGLPMVLHVRKAMDLVFEYSKRLARLPAVVLHSYSGTAGEAEALLGRGVEAWFSFGAAILNSHKRAIAACAALGAERLLAETDAPWQPPRGEGHCRLEHLRLVLAAMAALRGAEIAALEERLEANFRAAFGPGAGEA